MRQPKKLKEFNVGDWFFNDQGKLMCILEKDDDGWYRYTDGHGQSTSNAEHTLAYDLTVHNKVIADNVQWYYREFSKGNLLTPKTSKRLEEYYQRLMELDEDADGKSFRDIYNEMDRYTHELKEHMSHFR